MCDTDIKETPINSPLKPEYFTYGSDKKVWWQCSNDHEHEWEAKIANRSRGGSHCSICRKKNDI